MPNAQRGGSTSVRVLRSSSSEWKAGQIAAPKVEHLRDHAADLRHTLRLGVTPAISGAVIVGSPQPMKQALANEISDARVVRLADIANLPWNAGW